MNPRITVITLGVDDLERTLRFYRDGLGLKTEGIVGKAFEHGAVAFFDLQGGLKLALWPRASLCHDSGLPLGRASATEFTIGHNVSSMAQVDAVMEQARSAGAVVVKPAQPTFWGGYAGYFQDPDQHLWEVVWNSQWADTPRAGAWPGRRACALTEALGRLGPPASASG
jgi:catechol 2,3-dioxygenase-like lactoylglutathione lyase family enzyme